MYMKWEIFLLQNRSLNACWGTEPVIRHCIWEHLKLTDLRLPSQLLFPAVKKLYSPIPLLITSSYLREESKISGARYQRVATYSVKVGLPWSSFMWHRERASPKSQSFTKQSASSKILEGWIEQRKTNKLFTLWIALGYYQSSYTSLILFILFHLVFNTKLEWRIKTSDWNIPSDLCE